MRGALGAERLKLRRSGAARLPLLGLLAGLLQGGLFLLSSEAVRTWPGLTAWHTLWTTFLSPLALALLAGLVALRQARARGGGLAWRPVSPRVLHVAEFAGLAVLALLTTALVILASLPIGWLDRLPAPPPLWRLLALTLTLWLASLPILALGQRAGRRFGLTLALLTGLVGAISGVLLAEHAFWWLDPWAWPVRASLTLTGTHANGVPLAPDDPVWQLSLWPPLLLALLATPALVLAAVPRLGRGVARPARKERPATRRERVAPYPPSALASELVKYRRTVLPWLTWLAPPAFALIAAWRHAPLAAWQGWALLVLPFGAALLPAAAWQWEQDAWTALRCRPAGVNRLYAAKLGALWLYANGSATLLAALLLSLGLSPLVLAPLLALHLAVSFALLAFHLWLAARFGPGLTLGAGAVLTLLALILGGTGLGQGVWPYFPWVWGWIPAFAGSVPLFVLAAVLIGVGMAWLGMRAAMS